MTKTRMLIKEAGSTTNFQKVLEFHRAFNLPILPSPRVPENKRFYLRINLINEEVRELKEELVDKDGVRQEEISLQHIAKELSDILYVVYGMAAEFGIDLDRAFAEVHNSNMSKLGEDGKPIYREDGKVLKGPHYREAKMYDIIKESRLK